MLTINFQLVAKSKLKFTNTPTERNLTVSSFPFKRSAGKTHKMLLVKNNKKVSRSLASICVERLKQQPQECVMPELVRVHFKVTLLKQASSLLRLKL